MVSLHGYGKFICQILVCLPVRTVNLNDSGMFSCQISVPLHESGMISCLIPVCLPVRFWYVYLSDSGISTSLSCLCVDPLLVLAARDENLLESSFDALSTTPKIENSLKGSRKKSPIF